MATRGEAGIVGMPPDKVGPLRMEEERRSAAIVGVREVEFLHRQDGIVEYGVPLRRDLAAAFRRLNPEVHLTIMPAHSGLVSECHRHCLDGPVSPYLTQKNSYVLYATPV